MLKRNARWLIAVGCFGTVVAAGAVAVASSGENEHLVASNDGPIAELQDAQRDSFAALRKPVEAGSLLAESSDRSYVGNPGLWGQSRQLARAIETPRGRGWVIPGRDVICLAIPDPVDGFGVSCASTSSVEKRGLPLIMSPGADKGGTLSLLLPDQGTATVEGRVFAPDANGLVFAYVRAADAVTVFTPQGGQTKFNLNIN